MTITGESNMESGLVRTAKGPLVLLFYDGYELKAVPGAVGHVYSQARRAARYVVRNLKRTQVRTVLDNSGLREIGAKAGVTPAMLNQCFANDAHITALVKSAEAAFGKIRGTPAFEINGALVPDVNDWHALEPKLRAAGAR